MTETLLTAPYKYSKPMQWKNEKSNMCFRINRFEKYGYGKRSNDALIFIFNKQTIQLCSQNIHVVQGYRLSGVEHLFFDDDQR